MVSGHEQPEPDPLVITVTAEVRGFATAERRPSLYDHPAAVEFRKQMDLLRTQTATAPEDAQRLAAGMLRLADIEDGEPQG